MQGNAHDAVAWRMRLANPMNTTWNSLICWRSDWQGDNESRSLGGFAFHSDVTLMKGYDLFNDGESHTATVILTTVGTIGLKKPLEYTLLVLDGNTYARVGYSDGHVFDILFDADVNHAAILGKFDAIANDVRPYLV